MSSAIIDLSQREQSPCGCVVCDHCGGVELSDDCDIRKHNAIVNDDCSLPAEGIYGSAIPEGEPQ